MQDLRGTPILKTKPLLSYSAAAGIIAGVGDGLQKYGSAQTINSNGSLTTFSASNIAQSAAGGAISNPANRVSEYIMKIADIYHPLVVARAGRKVSLLFTKGFWIDRKHQVYESGKALDNRNAEREVRVSTSNSPSDSPDYVETETEGRSYNPSANQSNYADKSSAGAESAFLAENSPNQPPLFAPITPEGENHG
jgi:conjugal transfer pilus assembly protein TraB